MSKNIYGEVKMKFFENHSNNILRNSANKSFIKYLSEYFRFDKRDLDKYSINVFEDAKNVIFNGKFEVEFNDFEVFYIYDLRKQEKNEHLQAIQGRLILRELSENLRKIAHKHFGQEYLDDYKKYIYNKVNTETKAIQSGHKNTAEGDKGLER